jgi:hypothetical protein
MTHLTLSPHDDVAIVFTYLRGASPRPTKKRIFSRVLPQRRTPMIVVTCLAKPLIQNRFSRCVNPIDDDVGGEGT